MPKKLQRHFHFLGIAIYFMALLTVSICFKHYMLKPLWMVWGIGTVTLFFMTTYLFYQRWSKDDTKKFSRKIFWTALGIRSVYVVAILYYYYYQTGVGLEYQAADSWSYHRAASYLSNLAREGHFRQIFQWLNSNTMGFSDQGYIMYLTTLYTLFGKNILGPRLLKALMSAYLCVVVYKLTVRSMGEKTGKTTAILAVFLPQFIHYNGTYMKETELIFVTIMALERFDFLIRTKKHLIWNTILIIVLTAASFGLRTVVGMILMGSYAVFIITAEENLIPKRIKWLTIGGITVMAVLFFITPIGKEMKNIFEVNFKESHYLVEKYRHQGFKYAEYASYKTMAPGAFTLPLTNMVEVANENQKMMNGTYYIKNYLAFFALWCIIVAIRDKKWRKLTLIGSFTIVYVLMIAFSFAFNSERYHLPAMPGIVIMTAFAMNRFRKKDFKFYYAYCGLLVLAIVAWNYFKLSARGLIF